LAKLLIDKTDVLGYARRGQHSGRFGLAEDGDVAEVKRETAWSRAFPRNIISS
jgi:hypothetical protein